MTAEVNMLSESVRDKMNDIALNIENVNHSAATTKQLTKNSS